MTRGLTFPAVRFSSVRLTTEEFHIPETVMSPSLGSFLRRDFVSSSSIRRFFFTYDEDHQTTRTQPAPSRTLDGRRASGDPRREPRQARTWRNAGGVGRRCGSGR